MAATQNERDRAERLIPKTSGIEPDNLHNTTVQFIFLANQTTNNLYQVTAK